MKRTALPAAALLVLAAAFGVLFAVLSPAASAASLGPTDAGRYPHAACDLSDGGAVNPDLVWVGHAVGCDTDVTGDLVNHLITLRDSTCEGLRSEVPAAQLVNALAADLGDRSEAVTLFTATSVYCYGG